jgi:hypothetical protein
MDRVTQQTAAGAEESAASAEEMRRQAETMQVDVNALVRLVSGRDSGTPEGPGVGSLPESRPRTVLPAPG